MNPNELGFIIVSLFALVLAIAGYVAVRIWGDKK